ncbi:MULTISPECIES: tetratricopeptide repeat protein [unclassified Pseudodesulfovibrio]|uniref:tetratricopeptide repeat protein n=1 Tax=unclassified Pseudodesulfovibrio TaxID=2661612 RepID=UPI001005B19F|nr:MULTISPECIES: tetratricopeptide repeat protein [unclassified Pseudodesulfovibrio]MCJ2163440.1 tetratricopeptide repeat protein [Pseudodesulfovibrio sp. S3-i]RWU06676.1 tetratricopeptide repeat protein [Pseudodesulfovibrio sp. S3]
MKDYMKFGLGLFGGFLLMAFLFFMSRHIDFVFLKAYQPPITDLIQKDYLKDFSGYRDFVTIISGLLAIIMGAAGFGSFIAYRNIKAEEIRLSKLRTKFEVLLKIEEGRAGSDSESDPESGVKVYKDTGMEFDDYYVLYLLRADAFRKRGKDGDYALAERDYRKALEIHGNSPKGWYGLGLTKYLAVRGRMEYCEKESVGLDIENVSRYKLTDNTLRVKEEDFVQVKEAIICMKKAISCEYNESIALFDIGNMHESMGDIDKAIDSYNEAYKLDKSNTTHGFYYAYSWIKKNAHDLSHVAAAGVEEILKQVGMMNLYLSKPAYALLWYLYSVPSLKDEKAAQHALSATNQYVIDDLFEM